MLHFSLIGGWGGVVLDCQYWYYIVVPTNGNAVSAVCESLSRDVQSGISISICSAILPTVHVRLVMFEALELEVNATFTLASGRWSTRDGCHPATALFDCISDTQDMDSSTPVSKVCKTEVVSSLSWLLRYGGWLMRDVTPLRVRCCPTPS